MCVAIDLSAAFDTVDHGILLQVLHKMYGIDGKALNWFESYLADRKFQVCVNGSYSKVETFNYSVPQGSCCGANLFCVYASSIRNIIPQNINLSAYADDHTLFKDFDPNTEYAELDTLQDLCKTLR